MLAVKEKVSVEPCQLCFSFSRRTGSEPTFLKRSSNERSTVRMTSSLVLLCETVTFTVRFYPKEGGLLVGPAEF